MGSPIRSRMKSMSRWMVLVLTSNSRLRNEAFGCLPDAMAVWMRIIRSNGGRDMGNSRTLFFIERSCSQTVGMPTLDPPWLEISTRSLPRFPLLSGGTPVFQFTA